MAIHKAINYKILGDATLRELPTTRLWSPDDGISSDHHFVGPADKVQEYFNEISVAGWAGGIDEMSEDFNGKSGKLLCRVFDDSGGTDGGNTEALNSVWELIAQQLLKPIESHPWFDAISAKDKRDILERARNSKPRNLNIAEKVVAPPGGTDVVILYIHYAHSVMDYLSTDLILRKTTRLSGRSEVKASYTGINTVVAKTLPELESNIGPPAAIIDIAKNLPKLGTTDGSWEWLKLGPQVRQITKRKFQLVYTWHGASRWSILYGGSWVPGGSAASEE